MAASPRSPNHLLASLSEADFELIRPYLRYDDLLNQAVLLEAGDQISKVYFPHSGIISLVVRLQKGEAVETAMVGKSGVFGAGAVLDWHTALNTAIVQLPGTASILDAGRLRAAADQSVSFRTLVLRYEHVILAQVQQTAACNASHTVQARLSKWLLHARDLNEDDKLNFTQECLAQMLGVQRNSVSIVANALQRAGLIRYQRGRIEITDLKGLIEKACECYMSVRENTHKLIIH